MPPGRKSSSSHSRSRSRSSSSRSRSRSSSRSSSRSRSSHSRSSHSSYSYRNGSTSRNYSGASFSGFGASSFAYKNRRPMRNASAAPSPRGYRGNRRVYHCFKHDYYYYDSSFMDAAGTLYSAGYYDENGAYYPDMEIREQPSVSHCECKYCGTDVAIDISSVLGNETGMKTFTCTSCGAALDLDHIVPENVDYMVLTEDYQSRTVTRNKQNIIATVIIAIFGINILTQFVIPLFAFFAYTFVSTTESEEEYAVSYSYSYEEDYEDTESNVELFGERVYVPEIERYCVWSEEYECYYDNATECFFWYNNEIATPQIQYWYEDFSSEYEESGWLEYDWLEDAWYVEVYDGEWEIVDEVPDYFWYTSYESLLGE